MLKNNLSITATVIRQRLVKKRGWIMHKIFQSNRYCINLLQQLKGVRHPQFTDRGNNQKSYFMKILIIANRLPVKIERTDDSFIVKRSEGGLATGLGSLEIDAEMHWVGWP